VSSIDAGAIRFGFNIWSSELLVVVHSLGFLGQTHTMVTYTRASDSVLCVPLMIDGAVLCDYFSALSWPCDKVAKALSYQFKINEGDAVGKTCIANLSYCCCWVSHSPFIFIFW